MHFVYLYTFQIWYNCFWWQLLCFVHVTMYPSYKHVVLLTYHCITHKPCEEWVTLIFICFVVSAVTHIIKIKISCICINFLYQHVSYFLSLNSGQRFYCFSVTLIWKTLGPCDVNPLITIGSSSQKACINCLINNHVIHLRCHNAFTASL